MSVLQEFTMAEIEYQVEEMLFKMNALAGTSGLPDKPNQYFTDSDCTYASPGEDAVSSGSEVCFIMSANGSSMLACTPVLA